MFCLSQLRALQITADIFEETGICEVVSKISKTGWVSEEVKSEAAHLWRSWSKVTIEAEILKYSTEEAELRTDAAKLKTDAGKLKTDAAKVIEMADQQIVIAGRLTDSATKLDSKADELSDQAADAAAKSIQAKQRLNRLVEAEPTKGANHAKTRARSDSVQQSVASTSSLKRVASNSQTSPSKKTREIRQNAGLTCDDDDQVYDGDSFQDDVQVSQITTKKSGFSILCRNLAKLEKKVAKYKRRIAMYKRRVAMYKVKVSDQTSALESVQGELDELREEQLCVVCEAKKRSHVYLCGHALCVECVGKQKNCPLCRGDVTKIIKLYMWLFNNKIIYLERC